MLSPVKLQILFRGMQYLSLRTKMNIIRISVVLSEIAPINSCSYNTFIYEQGNIYLHIVAPSFNFIINIIPLQNLFQIRLIGESSPRTPSVEQTKRESRAPLNKR